MTMSNDFLPGKLKELRKSHNYTQDYVASSIGTVRQTYSHYETGKRIPGAHIIYKLAGLYNISVDDLLSLTLDVDRNENYDAPTKTFNGIKLENYLNFINEPTNKKKYSYLTSEEKELIYGFSLLSEDDKYEIMILVNAKLQRKFTKK